MIMNGLRNIVMVLALSALSGGAVAARSASEIFCEAPDSVFKILSSNARKEMVVSYQTGMTMRTVNSMDGTSAVTDCGDRHIDVSLADKADMTMVVLPERNDTVVAVITTLKVPVADSAISFYRLSDWKLAARQPSLPGLKEFTDPALLKPLGKDAEMPPFLMVGASYDEKSDTFVFENNTTELYVPDDVNETIRETLDVPEGVKALRKKLVCRYRKGKFVPVR